MHSKNINISVLEIGAPLLLLCIYCLVTLDNGQQMYFPK